LLRFFVFAIAETKEIINLKLSTLNHPFMEPETNLLNEFSEPSLEYASTGQRFLNYIIDLVAFYLLASLAGVFIGVYYVSTGDTLNEESGGFVAVTYLVSFAVFFAYYTLFEGAKGKILGKLITKTRVVREDGEPMTYGKAFVRTLCRIVPFEAFSAFFGIKMWHDSWTNTMVIKN
jgi:uncharacterized RDD family membrane protein YckC